jgi:hypothetical protein
MKRLLCIGALALLFTTACNQGVSVRDSGSFESAPADLKTLWQVSVAAAKTNGYLAAYTNLQTLQAQSGLSSEQAKAVESLIGVVGTRMFNAANKGDPEATKALKEVESLKRR